jgi:hypothetical protein
VEKNEFSIFFSYNNLRRAGMFHWNLENFITEKGSKQGALPPRSGKVNS